MNGTEMVPDLSPEVLMALFIAAIFLFGVLYFTREIKD